MSDRAEPHRVKSYLLDLQDKICRALESLDSGMVMRQNDWSRELGGGGRSRAMQGEVFEKAGVNFSDVWGDKLPPAATTSRPELEGCKFRAMGVSLIVHPKNPYVPTSHANVRFFFADKDNSDPVWWFGGGFDLTPYYGFAEDAIHWHETARIACSPLGESAYRSFKARCDEYFKLPHRNEQRGVGGLFFDDFNERDFSFSFAFMRSVGDHFLPAYLPIVQRRMNHPYGKAERDFQLYRRGRYVEFNLLWDRGTKFGLQSGGHTEAILMSLPPLVRWEYGWQPAKGSKEEELYEKFLKPRDWLGLESPGS